MSIPKTTVCAAAVFAMIATAAASSASAQGAKESVVDAAPWASTVDQTAKEADAVLASYTFRNGKTLADLRLHYATLGEPRRDASGDIVNAVLVLHWTASDSRVLLNPTYMKALFGPGRPLDASRYYLVFPDAVGHGRSSKPSDGLRTKFPRYGYADIVDLQHKLVEQLGVRRLHAILGMSMGGMNAWQWAEAYPDSVDGIMPVVSMPMKVSGRNMIWRRLVIDAITSDPNWRNGDYDEPPAGWRKGYALLRMMIDSVGRLQAEAPDERGADAFIADAGRQAATADANDVLYSLRSSADYAPEPQFGEIKAKVFALNFSDDAFNPAELQSLKKVIPRLAQGRYVVQDGGPSGFGHLTMAHPDLWAQHVADFMRWLETDDAAVRKLR